MQVPLKSSSSSWLNVALSLMISQIIINLWTGCFCCRRNWWIPDDSWTVALASFVLSQFTYLIVFLLFLTGDVLNDQRGKESLYFGTYYYYVVKPAAFLNNLPSQNTSIGQVEFCTNPTNQITTPFLFQANNNQTIIITIPEVYLTTISKCRTNSLQHF